MKQDKSYFESSLIVKNTVFSFAGKALPLVIGIIAIPFLIDFLGVTRFGILTLAWVFIGYSSIFDLGLSRAGIKFIADCISEGQSARIPYIFWSLLLVVTSIGIVAGLILVLSSSHIVPLITETNSGLEVETLWVVYVISALLPVMLIISALNAYLTAYQRFDWISSIQVLNGVLNYSGPVLILLFYDGLIPVMIVLLAIKIVVLILYLSGIKKTTVQPLGRPVFSISYISKLAGYGGWVSVSNVLSPLIDYVDRFLIAFFLGASVVAFFTTPFDVLIKLGIIPMSIVAVLFPAISGLSKSNREKAVRFTRAGISLTLMALFPIAAILMLFTEWLLQVWIGVEFAEKSAVIAQILLVGIYYKAFSNYSVTYLHGVGLPKNTAIVHLIESILYISILTFAIKYYGLVGAAVTHAARLIIDFYLLESLIMIEEKKHVKIILKSLTIITVSGITLAGLSILDQFILKIVIGILIIPLSIISGWMYLLHGDVKRVIKKQIDGLLLYVK